MLLGGVTLSAQSVVSVNLPTMCAGGSYDISVGFETSNNIVISNGESSQAIYEKIFLPDGESCGTLGCSYRSHVTFTDFPDTAIIRNTQDIQFVRLNIEHSWIGDLYINITCPNNSKADILRKHNSGYSSCDDAIPSSSRGWQSGNNMPVGTHLGIAYDYRNSFFPCDSSANGNEPGIGWNYCWSNNSSIGINYAPGNGLIYRNTNVTSYRVDSSNVAGLINFYHPDQNFSNLIGCPLNGDWYIEVVDGWSGDNGYIFEWELALNPELLAGRQNGEVISKTLLGSYISSTLDSSVVIDPPDNITSDTTVAYTVRLVTASGNVIDSVIYFTFHPTYLHETYDTICSGQTVTWNGHTYSQTGDYSDSLLSQYGCDSVVILHLLVQEALNSYDTVSICINALPYSWGGQTINNPSSGNDYLHQTQTANQCDSTAHLHLVVNPIYSFADTLVLCSNALPYLWHDTLLSETSTSGSLVRSFQTINQCDSLWNLQLTINPVYLISDSLTLCSNMLPYLWHDTLLPSSALSGDFVRSYQTTALCDSVWNLNLTVNPIYNFFDTLVLCNDALPYQWHDTLLPSTAASGMLYQTYHTAAQCDSIWYLSLTINPTYILYDTLALCDNQLPYQWHDTLLSETTTSGSMMRSFLTNNQCDSLWNLQLTINPVYLISDSLTLCSNMLPYQWHDTLLSTETVSGNFLRHFLTTTLCDSVWDLSLTVHPAYLNNDTLTLCNNTLPYQWHDTLLATAATSGIIVRNHNTIHNCDSIWNLHLIVMPSYNLSDTLILCNNALPYLWHDTLLPSSALSGDFVRSHQTAALCDSVWNLSLTINPTYNFFDTLVLCDDALPYQWHDTLLPSNITSGILNQTYHTAAQCDSIWHLSLTVNLTYLLYDTIALCDNQLPYQWHDTLLTILSTSGDMIRPHQTASQCDSTWYLHFTIHLRNETLLTPSICQGETYQMGGNNYTEEGHYTAMLSNQYGCDSLIDLTLTVNPTYDLSFYDTICDNQTSLFESVEYSNTGSYPHSFVTSNNCDSLRTLHLQVYPTYLIDDHHAICYGTPYKWIDGIVYTEPTTEPTIVLTSSRGCDSVYHLILSIDTTFMATMHITPHIVTFDYPIVYLTNQSQHASTTTWHYGDQVSHQAVEQFDYYSVTNEDSLIITLITYNTLGCVDTATAVVHSDMSRIWAPNVFTPHEDINNRWSVAGYHLNTLHVALYDRAGRLIHTFEGLDGYWDGTMNGTRCPQAAYVYKATYTTQEQPRTVKVKVGTVLLLE
ncbi:MAG: T9SS type B sorting domain-containing protein [Bacteroidales bacterium]|nr:T9SS type B sorting domain-containing protein [Bacteroidales bacterium]